jgi:hypothetical protein
LNTLNEANICGLEEEVNEEEILFEEDAGMEIVE